MLDSGDRRPIRLLLIGLLIAVTGGGTAAALVWGPRVGLSDLYLLHQTVVAGGVAGVALMTVSWVETVLARVALVHIIGSAAVGVTLGAILALGIGLGKGFPMVGAGGFLIGAALGAGVMHWAGLRREGVLAVLLGSTYCYAFVLVVGILGPYPSDVTVIGLVFVTLWLGVLVQAGTQEAGTA